MSSSVPVEPVCNILIVDDEPSNLLALEAILEPLDQNVIRAGSGVEALRHALKMEFCVVLLDVQMPEMDGLETAELLRRRLKTRDVPIIFLTAINKDSDWVARGYSAGAVDYLFKPYDPDTLRTKVATFVDLGKKNMRMKAQHEALRLSSQRELADLKQSSERRYDDLADSIPQVVWTADANGKVTYRNKQWDDIAPGNDGFAAIVHPQDLAAFQSGWESALKTRSSWDAELRIGAPSLGYRYHVVRAVPRDAGWVGTATDIDARVRADRSLRMLADASQRLHRSLSSDADPRAELDAVLRTTLPSLADAALLDLIEVNERPKTRIAAAVKQVDAHRFDDPRFDLGPSTVGYSGRPEAFLDVRHELEHMRGMRESERNPNPSGKGAEHLKFLGELGVSAYICVPLVTRDHSIGTLTFVRVDGREPFEESDVTLASDLARRIAIAIDNIRLHETTEKRRVELEEANQSKDLFLATLSHELRTPLNAIVGWTDMMRRGQIAGDELRHAMETIDRNALALSGLVADLLDVSRIVTGTLKIEQKYVPLLQVVDSAVAAARPQCTTKNITLALEVTAKQAAVVGDSGRLRQIIANLLSNAVKFTPNGGKVGVRVEGDDQRLRVVVSDSGEGIAPDFLPHVFERFKQAETARTRGLGLGLAIVKHLVEEHGGTVSAASNGTGKGSTFAIELPVAGDVPAAISEEQSVEATGEPDLTGVSILIVEDDPDGNELICTILERYGAQVTSATTATEALEALGTLHPDVLVSDIGLPDMDGMDLIRAVRARADVGDIPAVALTAYASRQDATKAIGAGFDAHVAKPVQPATLGGAVARLLQTPKPARAARSVTAAEGLSLILAVGNFGSVERVGRDAATRRDLAAKGPRNFMSARRGRSGDLRGSFRPGTRRASTGAILRRTPEDERRRRWGSPSGGSLFWRPLLKIAPSRRGGHRERTFADRRDGASRHSPKLLGATIKFSTSGPLFRGPPVRVVADVTIATWTAGAGRKVQPSTVPASDNAVAVSSVRDASVGAQLVVHGGAGHLQAFKDWALFHYADTKDLTSAVQAQVKTVYTQLGGTTAAPAGSPYWVTDDAKLEAARTAVVNAILAH